MDISIPDVCWPCILTHERTVMHVDIHDIDAFTARANIGRDGTRIPLILDHNHILH